MRNHLKLDRFLDADTRAAFHALLAEPATTAKLAHGWLADRGVKISLNAVIAYIRRQNPAGVTHNRVLKLDKLLRPRHRGPYTRFLREPSTSLRDAQQWLLDKGYTVGLTAVRLHRQRLLHEFDDVRRAARLGVALAEAAAEAGVDAFKVGTLTRVDQLAMEKVFDLRKTDAISARDLAEWVKLVESSVGAHDKLQVLVQKMEEKLGRDAEPEAAPTSVDVKSAHPHGDVADRLSRILGVTHEALAVREAPATAPDS